jgi:alkyl sulfatase BDS1-like metallo-beta-lactamase superfamily hydrolase
MPNFITRVELHYGTAADYETLHRGMTAQNFSKIIAGADGKIYTLPTATYFSFGEGLTAIQVRELARQAAIATGKNFWILTDAYVDAAWYLNEAVIQ